MEPIKSIPDASVSQPDQQVTPEVEYSGLIKAEQWLGEARPGDVRFIVFADMAQLATTVAKSDLEATMINNINALNVGETVRRNGNERAGYLEALSDLNQGPLVAAKKDAEEIIRRGYDAFDMLTEQERDALIRLQLGIELDKIAVKRTLKIIGKD